ncbi:MAG: aldolase [Aquificae bacterium]|nr:aldolase [Aquificota bacterium]
MKKKLIRELIKAGRYLFEAGVVDRFSGNLSVRLRKGILITRSGSPLPDLTPADFVEVRNDRPWAGRPSSELAVHRRIYELTDRSAVAHAHPPSAVRLAFFLEGDHYEPADNEGRLLLGRVPILRLERPSASPELAEAVARALREAPCALVYSHGVFCAAERILDAAGLITALEFSARTFPLLRG